jgi:outer membrane immunogenic protein
VKKLLFGTTAIIALVTAQSAGAANLSPPTISTATAYNWTGCYAGAHAGGGALNDSFVGINGGGGIAGGQLGCNLQTGAVVFGIEGEAAWSGLRNSIPSGAGEFTDRNRWSADIAARAGVAIDRALIYGKVGAAEGRFEFSGNSPPIFRNSSGNNGSGTLTGLLLGAGIEYAFAPNWSAKLEYDHIDYLGRVVHFDGAGANLGGGPISGPFDQSVSTQTNIVKAGINYPIGDL